MRNPQPVDCPALEPPECDDESSISWASDEWGCEVLVCEPRPIDTCPLFEVQCEPEEEAVLVEIDAIGCEVWDCVLNEGGLDQPDQPPLDLNARESGVEASVTWSVDERYSCIAHPRSK